MTDEQRLTITRLRSQGVGYKKIAQELALPVGTIQSFCRRENLTPQKTETVYDAHHCKQCGKPLAQKPGVKRRKFCSDECRILWWTKHPPRENADSKSAHAKRCTGCGRTFIAFGKAERKYCSQACYFRYRFGGDAS